MAENTFPVTRLTLIGALSRGLRWEEFIALYGRQILLWGRRDFGLQDSDAENLRQEVLLRVWRGVTGYDPRRGRFRGWLYGCTRNAVADLWRERRGEAPADSAAVEQRLRSLPAEAPPWSSGDGDLDGALRALDEQGFAQEDLQRAVASVRARVQSATWKAFLLFDFFDMKARDVAARVGLTPAAVNQAVYRVRQLLQQALKEYRP